MQNQSACIVHIARISLVIGYMQDMIADSLEISFGAVFRDFVNPHVANGVRAPFAPDIMLQIRFQMHCERIGLSQTQFTQILSNGTVAREGPLFLESV